MTITFLSYKYFISSKMVCPKIIFVALKDFNVCSTSSLLSSWLAIPLYQSGLWLPIKISLDASPSLKTLSMLVLILSLISVNAYLSFGKSYLFRREQRGNLRFSLFRFCSEAICRVQYQVHTIYYIPDLVPSHFQDIFF